VGLRAIPVAEALCVSPLDFNFVQPGASRTQTLQIGNCGDRPVTITAAAISDPGNPAAFSATPASGTIAPGQELDVPVTFSPPVIGEFTGALEIDSDDAINQVGVPLTGIGGGAAVACLPEALDFGPQKAGSISWLYVTCTNTGTDVPGHPEAALDLSLPWNQSGFFSFSFYLAGSNLGLTAGQSAKISVGYAPRAVEQDTGALSVLTNVTSSLPPVVALSGSGVQ